MLRWVGRKAQRMRDAVSLDLGWAVDAILSPKSSSRYLHAAYAVFLDYTFLSLLLPSSVNISHDKRCAIKLWFNRRFMKVVVYVWISGSLCFVHRESVVETFARLKPLPVVSVKVSNCYKNKNNTY